MIHFVVFFEHNLLFVKFLLLHFVRKSSEKNLDYELECEEKIISDKHRFGRVRSKLMSQLREEYGEEIANRSLARINKRISVGSKMTKIHSEEFLL